VIGTVGEPDKIDAQEAFVRAAGDVIERVGSAQFLIVGESGEGERLRKLIYELNIQSNVTFAPTMDQRKAFSVMDICVLPSVEEGPGHTILEAMAAARPVIAIGAGAAFAAVKDEETGLLVEKSDPGSLSRAVLRLLADRDLARRLGMRGRKVATETYPLRQMLEETLRVYRDVVG
ncbi:glycosyltransferase family 4 protein, partial [Planctomycetota bacterium]